MVCEPIKSAVVQKLVGGGGGGGIGGGSTAVLLTVNICLAVIEQH